MKRSICVYLRGDLPGPMGCGEWSVPGGDYCPSHLNEAGCCVVATCAADTVTAHPALCQAHLQLFIQADRPPLLAWLPTVP